MVRTSVGPTLSCYDFGRELLRTNDLDPVYVLLWEARLAPEQLQRWLLGYWCFYHSGTASWVADGGRDKYWDRMFLAAGSKEYPRCHERRHFRGAAALKSVDYLRGRGVENLFAPLAGRQEQDAGDVVDYVQTWVGFGPWIAFKVADMMERLGVSPLRFDGPALSLFDSPRKGAIDLWNSSNHDAHPNPPAEGIVEWAVDKILRELGPIPAPPRYERPINIQEAETVLCKWHSHLGGHYDVGEDIDACRKGLAKFGRTSTAQKLLSAGRAGGLW